MNTSSLIVAGLIAAFGISYLVGSYQPRQRARRAHTFASSVGLTLPVELRDVVTDRIALRHRGGAAGLVIGVVAAALVLGTDPSNSEYFATPFLLIGGAFAGAAIGVAIAATRASAPLDPTAVKFARSSAVSLSDYVAPLERTGGRIVVALGVATLIAAIATGAEVNPVLIALGALGAASLLVFEIVGRRIVARAQPAASPSDLAWDDAVRASVLRDMITAPIVLGLDTVVVAGGALIDHSLAVPDLAQVAFVIACFVVAGLLATAAIVSRPQRYFLSRLWPAVLA